MISCILYITYICCEGFILASNGTRVHATPSSRGSKLHCYPNFCSHFVTVTELRSEWINIFQFFRLQIPKQIPKPKNKFSFIFQLIYADVFFTILLAIHRKLILGQLLYSNLPFLCYMRFPN